MKKLFVAAFIGALTLSACSKKTETAESNTMMAEPDSTTMMSDSTSMAAPATMDSTAAAAPMTADSTKMAK
ncbi:hypothetical protein [Halpernia frigidisoli]|uniref:Coproporphyrinogen III oxidase n=1 Tax=Halpernia frigidisoli TaxID=1125876 RepID=A0A1I3DPY7_9FLAO|nr:hypothetical protein [Halpernia frigidisoli]SFH88802.1 hypothetical protein SAMN05443292_0630 [Halpernia frigidisoli]